MELWKINLLLKQLWLFWNFIMSHDIVQQIKHRDSHCLGLGYD